MSTVRNLTSWMLALSLLLLTTAGAGAQQQAASSAPAVVRVEIKAPAVEAEVGKPLQFTATALDAQGKTVAVKPTAWFAAPFDLAAAGEDGTVNFYNPGVVKVGAIVGGKLGFASITVRPSPAARIDIEPVSAPLNVGGTMKLMATARAFNGNPLPRAVLSWKSDNPNIATVDPAGVVVGLAPGAATLRATSDAGSGMVTVNVVNGTVASLSVEPKTSTARTGDVVRFKASAGGSANALVRWEVSGDGAMIEPDGAFVAERPGTYVVTAISGDRSAVSSIVVSPRNAERELEVVGRAPLKDVQAAEQWIFGNYAYVSTISDKVLVYDISDPKNPKLTDTLKVDAHIVNDVSLSADGKIGVITREGASSRKNGIIFLDTSDLAHPKVLSEYTATVTGGVHSAYIYDHYVFLTDDATGSMRVIDFKDARAPKEVARWQVENQVATTLQMGGQEQVMGRYLHDIQVKDGLAYLAYWRDGLIILDVGNGIKGGSPENPKLVSNYRFNFHDLYGNGWLAGSHAVFRYKNYVFVGDEVFPEIFDISSRERIPVRGIVHVIDVTNIEQPRKVAEYSVPEAGAHNIWVEDDILYMGYYNGGARVVDVSGELRGELYRQGREIGKLWTGTPDGYRANIPFTWGAQPHKGMVYFIDINSGLWIVRLGKPRFEGSTTTPGE
ncbi:MAG TPA: Ig-like domain-containing protein [Pyrinomonadaceae bacterium]|nr:Ig-like domain-containing protein [Pyrinomonadaceae bacterium]